MSVGNLMVIVPAPPVASSQIALWSMSTECVTAHGRIIITFATGGPAEVSTLIDDP